MADPIIAVNNVSKAYGGVKANVDISLTVERGSITGIIGPNGCGKTTLFNSIVGYHPIDAGSIKFDDTEIPSFALVTSRGLACCGHSSKPVSTAKWTVSITCRFRYRIVKGHQIQCLQVVVVKFAIAPSICLNLWVSIPSEA